MAAQAAAIDIDLGSVVKQVAQEKGIDPGVLIETMQEAILKAAQAAFGADRELEATFKEETGNIELYQYMVVVENVDDPEREIPLEIARRVDPDAQVGDELGFQIFWHPRDAKKAEQQDRDYGDVLDIKQARSTFGRIAAQTAKQVLLQGVRKAERALIYDEFKDRKGNLITGIVRRFEKGHNLIVDLGKTEALLPHREQAPRENYRPGDRIVAWVKDIDPEARGPMIILSRTSPELVRRLFEAEVPEITEGIVQIKNVAREPGSRSKIAVWSRDSDVDPVGACVGIKGSRVQAVVQELRGEKIDIVQWDEVPARYVIQAIQPADVNRVIVDEADRRMQLVVPDEKLSLAIGRKGQNVRLASQLTEWKLDIISENKWKEEEQRILGEFLEIESVREDLARSLYELGFRALEEVAEATAEELAQVHGVGTLESALGLRAHAEEAMERLRLRRVEQAVSTRAPLTERDKLRLVRGLGLRSLQLLEEAGYRTVQDIAQEDPDRLEERTGLPEDKVEAIQDGADAFLEVDWPRIRAARAPARPAADGDAPPARSSSSDEDE